MKMYSYNNDNKKGIKTTEMSTKKLYIQDEL